MGTVSSVTIGGDSVAVYALTSDPVADADSFWNVRIGAAATAWAAASDDDKSRSLSAASDWIDRSLEFTGEKTVAAQDREWPRDGAVCGDDTVADGTTPDDIAYAAFWLAGQIIVDTSAMDSGGTGSNVKSARAGTAKVEFFSAVGGSRLPQTAMDYAACYASSGSISGGTATGTTATTAFDKDDYDRSSPFA